MGAPRWTMQLFIKRDRVMFRGLPEQLRQYANQCQSGKTHPFTDVFIDEIFTPHIEDMASQYGLFDDNGLNWGGRCYDVTLCVYRRGGHRVKQTPKKELDAVVERIQLLLKNTSIDCQLMTQSDIRRWLAKWLNPKPKRTLGDVKTYIEDLPELDHEKPFSWSLAEDVCSSNIQSCTEGKNWLFDGLYHRAVTIERLRNKPNIGELTRNMGNGSLIDRLPEGATIVVNWSVIPDVETSRLIERINKKSQSISAEADAARESIDQAQRALANGQKIINYNMGICLVAEDLDEMETQLQQTETNLDNFNVIPPENDEFCLDTYIRYLPFAYNPALEQLEIRSSMIFSKHLASIVPLYGLSRGTNHPGLMFYNRGGEPFLCDPLNKEDRIQNGHLFLFGPTGAGKSATLNYLMMLYAAMHNPRIIIVEAGNSFGLLMDYFKEQGFITSDMTLKANSNVSLPVFANSHALFDSNGKLLIDSENLDADDEGNRNNDEQRDILGEMLIRTKLMITGGRKKEEDLFTLADEGFIKNVLISASREAFHANNVLTISRLIEHIENEYLKQLTGKRAERTCEMLDAMRIYTQGFEGKLFNREQSSWNPDMDIMRIEMATLAKGKAYRDKLALAYITIIDNVIDMVEKNQRSGRPTIFLTDEGHVISTNPLTAEYKVLISKLTGRRMALWLWDATQNIEDFSGESAKMLSMFEWWVMLTMPEKEFKELMEVKSLTDAQQTMLKSASKAPGKYTEGVIASGKVSGLFRNVPPALPLALAGTEQHEKKARQSLMDEHGINEIEAAKMIAEQIAQGRRNK